MESWEQAWLDWFLWFLWGGQPCRVPAANLIQYVRHFSFPWDYNQWDSSFSARVSPCDFPQVNGVIACHYCFTWSLNLHPLTSCNTLEGFQGNRPTLQPPPIQQMHQRPIGTAQKTVKHSFFPFPSSLSLHCNLCCLQWKCRKNKRCSAGNGMRLPYGAIYIIYIKNTVCWMIRSVLYLLSW